MDHSDTSTQTISSAHKFASSLQTIKLCKSNCLTHLFIASSFTSKLLYIPSSCSAGVVKRQGSTTLDELRRERQARP